MTVDNRFRIVIYPARRGLLLRRQWRAKVVSQHNGNRLFSSSEGYNNSGDLIRLVEALFPGIPYMVMDDRPGAI
jgi:hypothetical protein